MKLHAASRKVSVPFSTVFAFFLASQLSPAALDAQTVKELKGRIIDSQMKPVPHVTVQLFAKDSSQLASGSSNALGAFNFRTKASGVFYLICSRAGFQTLKLGSHELDSMIEDGGYVIKIQEKAKKLQEVSVTAQKQIIERQAGKTLVNVESDIMATGSTALELLQKSPDIQLDENSNIVLKGKTSVQILIDGKTSYLSPDQLTKMLKNMPGSSIASFEIITQPGAQYEASGNGGVINIKTKTKHKKGFNADIAIGAGLGTSVRESDNLNLNYGREKFNIYGLYSFSNTPSIWHLSMLRKVINNGHTTVYDQNTEFHEIARDYLIKGGLDYFLTPRQTFGVSVNTSINPAPGYQNSTSLYQNKNLVTDTILRTHAEYPGRYLSTTYSLDYRFMIDTSGKEISLSGGLSTYKNRDFNQVSSTFFTPSGLELGPASVFRNFLPSNIGIRAIRGDYSSPVNSRTKWSTGLKYSRVYTTNSTRVDTLGKTQYATDQSQGNNFSYTESIFAAYGNLSTSIRNTTVQIGLRLEQTFSQGLSSYQNSDTKRHYLDFFPSISLSRKLNESNQLELSYSRRIDRPTYADLNPFKFYIDKNSFGLGNPFLRSQYTDGVEIDHTYHDKLITSLNLSWTKDFQLPVVRTDSTNGSAFRRPENINHRFVASLGASLPITVTKAWTILASASLLYTEFQGDSSVVGVALFRSKTGVNVNISHTISLPSGFKMDISGYFYSPSLSGFTGIRPQYLLNAGLKKSLFAGKGDLKFAFHDIFNISERAGHQVYGSTNRNFVFKNETRFASLTFTYRLGIKPKVVKHDSSTADEQDRASKTGN